LAAALAVLIGLAAPAHAQKTWDRPANIKAAATRLATLQKTRGALGTFEHIASCYATHKLASAYGQALEGCMVLDYLHSSSLAAVYARLTPEQRRETKVPDPAQIVATMTKRLQDTFAGYKLPVDQVPQFVAAIETHGLPVYAKLRFDKSE
jgi:hypothetical protein